MDKYRELSELIKKSDHIVFLGGAGVSTESGIPDFRSSGGLYNEEYDYPPEVILSHTFFMQKTEEFFDFYRKKMLYTEAEPNYAHEFLAGLEKKGKLRAVLTQNIDGLHRRAGSNIVLELHGNIYRNYCMDCGKKYGVDFIKNSVGIPRCTCGGIVKPDVVLYGEALDDYMWRMACAYTMSTDLFIVGGTSLSVFPASSLIDEYLGDNLVLINKSETEADSRARLVFNESICDVFKKL